MRKANTPTSLVLTLPQRLVLDTFNVLICRENKMSDGGGGGGGFLGLLLILGLGNLACWLFDLPFWIY